MSVHYRRRRPDAGATAASLAVAVGVGAATFYVVRLLLSRERLSGPGEGRRVDPDRARPSRAS